MSSYYKIRTNSRLRTNSISPPSGTKRPHRLPPGGGSAVGGGGERVQTIFARNPFPFRGIINFFFPKKKKLQKEVGEPAARPPRRAGYRPRKFRPHLTQGFSVQMGCHRGIANSPNRGFFPSNCGGQNPISITRPAPRAQFIFCRDRRPRLSALCVGASVCAQSRLPPGGGSAVGGGGERVQTIFARNPVFE